MESTPREKQKFTDYLKQQSGPNPAPVSGPTRPGQKLTDHIAARLRGDALPDEFSAAPAGVSDAVWKAAQQSILDPASPDHDLASALIDLANQLAALQTAGAQP